MLIKKLRSFWWISWNQGLRQATKKVSEQLAGLVPPVLSAVLLEKFPPATRSNSSSYLPLLKTQPKVSIIIPVYNSTWLPSAISSVLTQSYKNLELILVDDCSTAPETLAALDHIKGDLRVKVLKTPQNLNISGATNLGLNEVSGDWVAFMDHDDLLHPDALALFIRTLNDEPSHDIYFSDEAIIDSNDRILGIMRKCEPTLDFLLGVNLITHLCIVRKTALDKLGPLNSEFDGAQDHDLMIRAFEMGLSFLHMPYVLYGWRSHTRSTSAGIRSFDSAKHELPRAYVNGKKAIAAHLSRYGIEATVTDDAFSWYRVKYELPQRDLVSIIVPFKDQVHHLKKLIETLPLTAYKNFELVLVNNRSEQSETLDYLEKLKKSPPFSIKFLNFDEPFNYSRLHNKVVSSISNELLLFLNNDIEVKHPEWLDAMLEHIYRPNVAAVGCKLLRGNGSIQHAGMVFRTSVHQCAMNVSSEDGYYTKIQRDVSGVTAACMLIRKSAFEKVGGFDEVNFPIGFSDADLCLRIIRAGFKIMYTPFAELFHHESVSRARQEETYEKYALFRHHVRESNLVDRRYKIE
jgi:GT2 family glycosyltransferase